MPIAGFLRVNRLIRALGGEGQRSDGRDLASALAAGAPFLEAAVDEHATA